PGPATPSTRSSSGSQIPATSPARAGAPRPMVRDGVVGVEVTVVVALVRGAGVSPVSGSGGIRLVTVVGRRDGETDADADTDADVRTTAGLPQAKRDSAATSGRPSTRCQPTTPSTSPCGSASA